MNKNLECKKYLYRAFGLTIESDIILTEFLPAKGEPNVKIILGDVPYKISNTIESTENYQISEREFLCYIRNIGRYYIKDGNIIVVQPNKDADFNSVKVYLIATAMGILMLQRQMIPIHGSSVVINGQCIIFTGKCGAGKSTICSEMRKQGYEFLADDISVIDLDKSGVPVVQPAFPQQRLCSDTASLMGVKNSELTLACKGDDKYIYKNYKGFRDEPVRLFGIFEIIPQDNCNVKLISITGIEKIQYLLRNIYCYPVLLKLGMNDTHFKQLLDIVKKIYFYRVIRPHSQYTVEEQVNAVKEILCV